MNQTHPLYDETASFFDQGYIVDILHCIKSGKEATVWCAKAHPERPESHFALKLYRPIEHRGFRNDAVYHEGRFGRMTREVRALQNRTEFGREVRYSAWLGHEFDTLRKLHAAGVHVPRPISCGETGLLMELVGHDGEAAPPLRSLDLSTDDAERLFMQLLDDVATMLSRNIVHGDLSPYNVLVCEGRAVIIDLPQAVDARTNPNARELLARDIFNLCRYFARRGLESDPEAITADLWDRFERAEL